MQHSRGIKGEGWACGRKDEREAQNETWTLGCLNIQSICKTINQALKSWAGERERRERESEVRGDHPTLVAIMWIDIAQLSREDDESSGRSHVGDRKACVLLIWCLWGRDVGVKSYC